MPVYTEFSYPLNTNPYPWIFLAALFFGAFLSRTTRFTRQRRDAERARTRKWVLASLYLSLAVVCALGAVFIPGPAKIDTPFQLYFFAACSFFFFLAFRFKKSFGILALLLALALVLAVQLFLGALNAFSGETEIARIRVLSVQSPPQPPSLRLEVLAAQKEPVIIQLAGTHFAPLVKVVIFKDYFVFMGLKTWYRFEGISSFAVEKREGRSVIRQQDTDYYFPRPAGISEQVWDFFARHENRIPLVKSVQYEIDAKRARELSTYSVRVQNDGGVEILEIN